MMWGIKKEFVDDGLETLLLLQLLFEFTYITCNNVMFMLNGHNRRKTFFIIEAIWRGRRRTSGGNLDMYSPLCIYNDTSLLYACTVVFLEVVTYNTFLSFRLLLQFGYNNVKYFLVPSITLPYIYFLAQSLTNDNMVSQITLDKPLYGMQIMY